jgi:hypothetical protein
MARAARRVRRATTMRVAAAGLTVTGKTALLVVERLESAMVAKRLSTAVLVVSKLCTRPHSRL